MSAGTAVNQPRPQAAVVGLGLSQLAVQMAAYGSQHKWVGGGAVQGEEKRILLRFSWQRLQISRVSVGTLESEHFQHDIILRWKWHLGKMCLSI